MTRKHAGSAVDILTDPFQERRPERASARLHLLGGRFDFQSNSHGLLRLVAAAFAGLPRHRLPGAAPRFRVKLLLTAAGRPHSNSEPALLTMFSGASILGAASDSSSYAIVSAPQRAALVAVAPRMLRFPYHTRYELIEFAVFTLAARVQRLVPLHAACIGWQGRGLLLIGASGAGKSTLSLHCLLNGLEFLSEDSLFVAPDSLLATGVANFLHARRDSLRFLPRSTAALIRRSPVITRRSGIEKFEIDLRRPQFRLAPAPLAIAAVIFISRQAAGRKPLLTPVSRAMLLENLRSTQPYATSQPGWRTFTRRLAATPAFELRRGTHPAQAVAALQDLLAAPNTLER